MGPAPHLFPGQSRVPVARVGENAKRSRTRLRSGSHLRGQSPPLATRIANVRDNVREVLRELPGSLNVLQKMRAGAQGIAAKILRRLDRLRAGGIRLWLDWPVLGVRARGGNGQRRRHHATGIGSRDFASTVPLPQPIRRRTRRGCWRPLVKQARRSRPTRQPDAPRPSLRPTWVYRWTRMPYWRGFVPRSPAAGGYDDALYRRRLAELGYTPGDIPGYADR